MKIWSVLVVTSALSLAACGASGDADADGDGEISTEEARAAVANAGDEMKPEPGLYSVTMEFVSAEGMPQEIQDMMGAQMSQTTEFCMTPEMADAGFEESLNNQPEDEACTYERMNIDGGTIDMAMSCVGDDGNVEMTMAMTGTVSPTSANYTMISEGMMGEMGGGTIEMRVSQERTGDCAAED